MSDPDVILFSANDQHWEMFINNRYLSLDLEAEFTDGLSLPLDVSERIRAARDFFNSTPHESGESFTLSALSLYWAGLVNANFYTQTLDDFNRFIRDPVVSALADVFGDEDFACQVMQYCPGNELPTREEV